MHPLSRHALKVLGILVLLLLSAALTLAQEPLPLPPAPDGSEVGQAASFGGFAADTLDVMMRGTNDVNQLANIARSNGQVRVIVGLAAATGDGMTERARAQNIGMAQAQVLSTLNGFAYTLNSQYNFIPYMALTVDETALTALATNPMVTSIELDAIGMPMLDNTTTVIGAKGTGGAWNMGYRGQGYTVAVLDTGVSKTHNALMGRVVSEACYGSTYNFSGNTVRPWCPGGFESSTAPNSGLNCALSYAGCDHGTHVAGIISSIDPTHTGVAPQATIIAIQMFSRFDGPTCTSIYGQSKCTLYYNSDLLDALNRVYALRTQYNIAAVNMSLGGQLYSSQASCDSANSSIKAAFDKLRSARIAPVVAAGNNGSVSSLSAPGCISSAVSVGATTDADAVASFSNATLFLDLLAPGVSVMSSVPGAPANAKFTSMSGTSMAAPHVAGAWALMRQAVPEASVNDIEQSFKSTGKAIADIGTTFPRIRVNQALMHLLQFNPSSNYIFNRSFESNLQGWTLANKAANDRVVPDAKAPNGERVFRFSGPRNNWTTLTQNVIPNAAYSALGSLGAGDTITLSVCYNANMLSINPNPTLRLRVVFGSGAVETKVVKLARATGGLYKCDKSVTHTIVNASGEAIVGIEAVISFRAPAGGTLFVDRVSLK